MGQNLWEFFHLWSSERREAAGYDSTCEPERNACCSQLSASPKSLKLSMATWPGSTQSCVVASCALTPLALYHPRGTADTSCTVEHSSWSSWRACLPWFCEPYRTFQFTDSSRLSYMCFVFTLNIWLLKVHQPWNRRESKNRKHILPIT